MVVILTVRQVKNVYLSAGSGQAGYRLVGRQLQAFDGAEDDLLVFELRLAGLQPFSAVEGDLDRALVQIARSDRLR
jgi:hypothetical protein